ncbi:MAG: glycerol-3-phosphate dehydrogenase/oxidase [Gemmatimonadota bacterium]|nr:glycerol-3-phosphate dehydrogenase/oxidase [Gemmatimonadota bacterium]
MTPQSVRIALRPAMASPSQMPNTNEPLAGTTAERLALRGPLAVAGRQAVMATLANESFDVLVIGGGIVGAGLARDAALAGLSTALVERDDFASGTSSRSSRLVHGGVRYLEHGHLALVFESSRERRLLLALAPHLVRPLAFTWPVYSDARVPRWKLRAGLVLYDTLSLFRNVQRHHSLSASGVSAAEPALSHKGLRGGARYWDAATDDSRLTLANALAAREAGAVVLNHVDVVGGIRAGLTHVGRLSGVEVEDKLTRTGFGVSARVTVNATGPWSDATAAITGVASGANVMGSAGAHIAVPRHRLGNRDAITLVSPVDGRVMFVLPAGAHAIVGTTERPSNVGPDNIRATEQEISYLLHSVNCVFPYAQLTPDDVVTAWAGMRPLAVQRAGRDSANSASREHAVQHRDDGLVSVTGGKLTTYRSMAHDVLEHALTELDKGGSAKKGSADTKTRMRLADIGSKTIPLPGGDIVSRHATVQDAIAATSDAAIAERLASAYGSRWRNVWSYAQRDHSLARRLVNDLPYCTAEVPHAVEREMACKLADVLVRRTHIAFETRDNGRGVARRIAPLMGALLGWNDAQQQQELEDYERDVTRLFAIDPA